jgi:hypothetical protein
MLNEPIAIRRSAMLILLTFASLWSLAQSDTMSRKSIRRFDYDQIYSTNHWNLLLRSSMIFAPASHFAQGPVSFNYEPSTMITFGWMYEINFKNSWRKGNDELNLFSHSANKSHLNRWGIQTGALIALSWLHFNYSVPESYSGMGQYFGAPQKIQSGTVLVIPVYGVYRLPFYDRHHSWLANFKLGVDINIVNQSNAGNIDYGDYGVDASGNYLHGFDFSQSNNYRGFYFAYPSFHASAGINYILPNKKMLNVQIVGNYSPLYREYSTFTFAGGTPQSISGSASHTLSSIGIEFNYIFTRVRHMTPPAPGFTYETREEKRSRAANIYPYDGDSLPLRKRHYSLNKIFSTNHTNFVFRVNILPGHDYLHNANAQVYSRADIGLMGGWVYQINFKKRWGLQTGIEGEYNGDNIHFNISKAYSGQATDSKIVYSTIAEAGVNIPLYACYYVPLRDKQDRWLANFKLGVDLKYGTDFNSQGRGPEGTYTWSNGSQDLVSMTISRNHWTRFYNSFYASAGFNYVLPNKKMLNLQLIGNWSPFFQKTFSYSLIPGTAGEIDGSFNRTYSYIGIELNYILTNPLHMGRKHKSDK